MGQGEVMSHTPGPWEADDNEGFSIWRVYGGSKSIAEVIGDSAEADANARLIAAAPEMFEALCGAWMALSGAPDWMHREDEYADEIRAVRAAIAKATEGSK